jgi:uncharacterized membrane protein required for colicin V production
MVFDIIAGVLVLAFAVHGWRSATMLEGMRLVAVAAAAVLASLIGPEVTHFYVDKLETCSANGVSLFWWLLTFASLWGIIAFATRRLAEDLRDASIDHAVGDRLGGALLGAALGVALAYLLVAGLQVAKPYLPYDESAVARYVDKRNLHDRGIDRLADFISERWSTCLYDDEPGAERKFYGGRPSKLQLDRLERLERLE